MDIIKCFKKKDRGDDNDGKDKRLEGSSDGRNGFFGFEEVDERFCERKCDLRD